MDALNQRSLQRLILTVEANAQSLELLIAVCDDRNFQAAMIEAYEAELRQQGIGTFRTRLNPQQPSLRASLEALVEQEPRLRSGERAVVTVLNAEALLGVKLLNEEKTEQEKFFFSLQWTREALRRFKFAVVLWVPDGMATRLGQRAPDFWSWRGGVFEFVAPARLPTESGQLVMTAPDVREERPVGALSRADLQRQIEGLEESAPESSLLITLYNNLGEAYESEYAYEEALVQYEKALALAKAKNNLAGQVRSLLNLGNSLGSWGRIAQSVEYYEQGLEIACEIEDRNGEARSLSNLGNAYSLLGQYQRAIDFHQQSLKVEREIGDRKGEANSLMGLGNAYNSLGQYQQTIDFHRQSLEIQREIGDHKGEANSLGNLGIAYKNLGQYQRAIDFHEQSLEIKRQIGDRKGEANSLGNLGIAYRNLGQYQRTIDFLQQALEITREIGDRNGEANSWFNRSFALAKTDREGEAQQSFETAKALYEELKLPHMVEKCDEAIRELGINNSNAS